MTTKTKTVTRKHAMRKAHAKVAKHLAACTPDKDAQEASDLLAQLIGDMPNGIADADTVEGYDSLGLDDEGDDLDV